MLHIDNLHAEVAGKPILKGLSLALAALALTACGDLAETRDAAREAGGNVANHALATLDHEQVLGQLPPEARTIVTAYVGDLRSAAAAYQAEFGRLPEGFAAVTSVAGARDAAVSLIADGLGEQVPFASRETLAQAANGIVTAAERRILDQMRTENAGNQ